MSEKLRLELLDIYDREQHARLQERIAERKALRASVYDRLGDELRKLVFTVQFVTGTDEFARCTSEAHWKLAVETIRKMAW